MRDFITIIEKEQLGELFGLGKKKSLPSPAQITKRMAEIQQRKDAIYNDITKREEILDLQREQEQLTLLLRQQTPESLLRDLEAITEAGRSWVGNVRETEIHEITTRSEFQRELKKHWYLRGFLFPNRAYVWDGHGIVHPDAAEYLNHYDHDNEIEQYGVPVHLQDNRITIRHHSSSDEDVMSMYEQVVHSPIVKRLFPTTPEVWGEDNEGAEERLDNKDWGDTEASDWSRNWSVY